VGQESLDLWRPHFAGVALVVEQDVARDPADVGLFGADGIVLQPDGVADPVEQFFGMFFFHWGTSAGLDLSSNWLYTAGVGRLYTKTGATPNEGPRPSSELLFL